MQKIYFKIVFTDPAVPRDNLKLYYSDATGQPVAGSGVAIDADGFVALDASNELFPSFPAPLQIKRVNTRLATILITTTGMYRRMLHEAGETRSDSKTVLYTIEPTGVATPKFLSEAPNSSVKSPPLSDSAPNVFIDPKTPSTTTISTTTTPSSNTTMSNPPTPPQPTRLRGKVADLSARIIPRNVQVVFFAKATNETKTKPVGLVVTDNYGNFSTDYPRGTFDSVYAIVSSSPDEKIPVDLKPDGSMPDFTLLIMQDLGQFADQEAHDDCACHTMGSVPRLPEEEDLIGNNSYTQDIGGSCVNFTTPNRALEEFKYFKIVRTTDPEVKDSVSFFSPGTSDRAKRIWDEIGSALEVLFRICKQKNPLEIFNARPAAFTAAEKRDFDAICQKVLVKPSSVDRLEDFFPAALLKDSGLENGHEMWQMVNERRREFELSMNRVNTRREISAAHSVDWDDTPTTYMASSIAHGHILEFRQVWRADGYSMGDLLYSLPLAPGQKKQIVIYDWSRKEAAARSENLSMNEALESELGRDRDVNEIVDSVMNESMSGSSHVVGKGHSTGLGYGAGGQYSNDKANAIVGISGGWSQSKTDVNSTASQEAARSVSANSMQNIHDQTKQSASAVRNQRSTVVTTATQNESMSVTTEVIANHNHCHAVTMQYFEVLRHFALSTELADVQECLFIPLDMTPFDDKKIMRWEHILRGAVGRGLQQGFDAVKRYDLSGGDMNHDVYKIFPPDLAPGIPATYGDLPMESLFLEMQFEVRIARPAEIMPPDTDSLSSLAFGSAAGVTGGASWRNINPAQLEAAGKALSVFGAAIDLTSVREIFEQRRQTALLENPDDEQNWENALGFIPGWKEIRSRVLRNPAHLRDKVFQTEMNKCEWYRFYIDKCLHPYGISGVFNLNDLGLNLTVYGVDKATDIRDVLNGTRVTVRASGMTSLKRNALVGFWLKENDTWQLPKGSSVSVQRALLRYSNKYYQSVLFNSGKQAVDFARGNVIAPGGGIQLSPATHCFFSTTLTPDENRSPKREDLDARLRLTDTFNNELVRYHHIIWTRMDANRRFMLLDGFQVLVPGRTYWTTQTVNGQQQTVQVTDDDTYRSLASVTENRLIGTVGNTIIMPVARGYNLDPYFRWDTDEVTLDDGTKVSKLMHHYMPSGGFKSTPYRISVPTKGVFAEAVMGSCNACEKKDDSRFWRWEESPIDEPTAIQSVSTDSRRSDPGDLTAKDFAQPIVNIQNAPALPDPTGLGASMELLGKSGLFKDITGLEGNQQALTTIAAQNQQAAMHYSDNAKELAMQAANMKNSDKVQDTINNSNLSQEEKDELTRQHIQSMIGGNGSNDKGNGGKGGSTGGGGSQDEKPSDKRMSQIVDKVQQSSKGKVRMTDGEGGELEAEFEGTAADTEEEVPPVPEADMNAPGEDDAREDYIPWSLQEFLNNNNSNTNPQTI